MKHRVRRQWGQNFLKDSNLLNKLVALIDPEPEDFILEIGPGEGALTKKLSQKVSKLTAVEIDERLYSTLASQNELKHCTFINDDFLKTSWNDYGLGSQGIRVVGNIPYNITSPIIFKLLENRSKWKDAHLMVQKEVADRLAAKPGGKEYGRLTVMVQSQANVEKLITIPPDVFVPKPKVDSIFISIKPHSRFKMDEKMYARFDAVVRAAFGQRRKMLRNSLADFDLTKVKSINFNLRPETLSVEEFVLLSNKIGRINPVEIPG